MVADFGPDIGCQFGGISRSAYLFLPATKAALEGATFEVPNLRGPGAKAPESFCFVCGLAEAMPLLQNTAIGGSSSVTKNCHRVFQGAVGRRIFLDNP